MSTLNNPANTRETTRKRTIFLVQFAVLLALEALVCFTPLGSLPVGPLVATLSHIPVILSGVLLGTAAGAGIGFTFGLFSFLVWTFMTPNPAIAFIFTPLYSAPDVPSGNILSLVICFVPRILIGVVAGLVSSGLGKILPKPVSMSIAAVLGTLTNTILVLGGVFLFFPAMNANGQGLFTFIVAMAGWNAVLEIAVAIILTAPVCMAVKKATRQI